MVSLCVLQQHKRPNGTGEHERVGVQDSETHVHPFIFELLNVTVALPWLEQPAVQVNNGHNRMHNVQRDVPDSEYEGVSF